MKDTLVEELNKRGIWLPAEYTEEDVIYSVCYALDKPSQKKSQMMMFLEKFDGKKLYNNNGDHVELESMHRGWLRLDISTRAFHGNISLHSDLAPNVITYNSLSGRHTIPAALFQVSTTVWTVSDFEIPSNGITELDFDFDTETSYLILRTNSVRMDFQIH